MLGYPGAGKTTTAKVIHDLTGAVHLWADRVRNERYGQPNHTHHENIDLYDYLNSQTADLLKEGKSVIFDTGFNFYKDREHLRQIAKEQGAEVKLIWVRAKKELAKSRATHPDHSARNSYPYVMEEQHFERISGDLEPPKENESYIEIDGTKVTDDYIKDCLKLP